MARKLGSGNKIQRTHIELVLDESGSMGPTISDTIGGINEYLDAFRTKRGVTLHVTKFDDVVREIAPSQEISTHPRISRENYQPRATTALFDAIGRTINILRSRYNNRVKILLVIITDGLENASKEFNRFAISTMIRELESLGNYTVVYLGANQDAFSVGAGMAVNQGNTWTYDQNNIRAMTKTLTSNTERYMRSAGMSSSNFMANPAVEPDNDIKLYTDDSTDVDDKYRNSKEDSDT